MKFIHIADLHLGAKPDAGNAYSQNREQELWDSFRDIITICNQKKTDLLLIAGDLFHRQPLLRELKEMNSILEMLEHTEVVMIAGNHDYIKKNSYYRTFSWASHVHMICSQEIDCVESRRLSMDAVIIPEKSMIRSMIMQSRKDGRNMRYCLHTAVMRNTFRSRAIRL